MPTSYDPPNAHFDFPTRFVEYSAGTDCLPWIGCLEDEDGHVVGWVDSAGRVLKRTGDTDYAEVETEIAKRTLAWNSVRDMVYATVTLPIGNLSYWNPTEGKTDFWHRSPVACLLLITIRVLGRSLRGTHKNSPERYRVNHMISYLEMALAMAENHGLGIYDDTEKGPGARTRTEPAEALAETDSES